MLDVRGPDSFTVLPGAHSVGTAQNHFEFSDIANILHSLLGYGCDLEANNITWDAGSNKWETALHQACSIVNPQLISFLIDAGADVDPRGYFSETPLHRACSQYGTSEETIQNLVAHGADTNALDCAGRSPLLEACLAASFDVLKCLVANGAMVKAYGKFNHHPIHFACRRRIEHPTTVNDTAEVIDYIVRLSEPDVFSIECSQTAWQSPAKIPLDLAIEAKNWEAVQHLKELGANTTTPGLLSFHLWECAADARGQSFVRLMDLGAFAAGKCAHHYNQTIIAYYVERHSWHNKAADEDFEENLKALLQAGADINACSYFSSYSYNVPGNVSVLHMARGKGLDDSSIQVLLRHGAVDGEEPEGGAAED